jgi:cyclopropane fatty-acyl-phospholipid synthase-like methyltransferase
MNLDKLLARRLPDPLLRMAVKLILNRKAEQQVINDIEERQVFISSFVEGLKEQEIAVFTDDANAQHYELPPQFFKMVLGKMLKYSCGYWPDSLSPRQAANYLDCSEEEMLALTCSRAEIANGLKILDLGCGWGAASLYMAREYSGAEITAVSNSTSQIEYIKGEAKRLGFSNLTALKADINELEMPLKFDRIVTVEMFEHMRNYEALLSKVGSFIKPRGKLFIHIFTHHTYPFLYEDRTGNDWMARHFFTGGTMPSKDLLHHFLDHFSLEKQWAVSGTHYRYTLEAWLQNMDRQREEIYPLFVETYGAEQAEKWWNYWRLFFISCAEFFGFRGGNEWFISHYLLSKR